jgi:hypothetical protein
VTTVLHTCGVSSASKGRVIATLDKLPTDADALRILGELAAATKLPVHDLYFVTFEKPVKVSIDSKPLPATGIVSEETLGRLREIEAFNAGKKQ